MSASEPHIGTIGPPWSTQRQVVPLLDLEGRIGERVRGLKVRQVNLYRSLAHAPELPDAWINWAWALRERCSTPRALREIMILRTAVVMRSAYEWRQHVAMAGAAGVPDDKVRAVAAWQTSDVFDPAERAALMLTDAMLTGNVLDAVHDELARHFSESERVELILTAGFYAMVPRARCLPGARRGRRTMTRASHRPAARGRRPGGSRPQGVGARRPLPRAHWRPPSRAG